MRFHLIDRVDSWEAGTRLVGRKATSPDETYWEPSPYGPVMPGGLVLEAFAQAGTWLLLLSTDFRRRAALGSVSKAEWRSEVVPGDVLEMDVTLLSHDDSAAVLSGTVKVGDRVVLEADGVMCAVVDSSLLEDPADTARMGRQLLRTEALR